MPEPMKSTVRAPDFRYFPVDAIGFQFNDDVIKLVFGVEDLGGNVLEQSGVMISHASGKLLLILLQESIRRFESRSGREIALNPEKLAEIMKVFSATDTALTGDQGQT